jgi:hypothetical protein
MLEFEKNALAANYEYQTHIKLGLQKNYEKIFKMTGWMTQSKYEKTKKRKKKLLQESGSTREEAAGRREATAAKSCEKRNSKEGECESNRTHNK